MSQQIDGALSLKEFNTMANKTKDKDTSVVNTVNPGNFQDSCRVTQSKITLQAA